MLPLDLHVLSLPLAFILSQDQTLHCKKMFCYKSLALISKVLFEITLLREWKKTFSCSNTSKNAVRLYCYKEQFLSFCRVSPFGFPRCSDRDFSAESGAKISHIFWTTKSFWKNFFRNFQNLFFYRFEPYFLFEAGAKIRAFNRYFQIFRRLFFNIFGAIFTPCYASAR